MQNTYYRYCFLSVLYRGSFKIIWWLFGSLKKSQKTIETHTSKKKRQKPWQKRPQNDKRIHNKKHYLGNLQLSNTNHWSNKANKILKTQLYQCAPVLEGNTRRRGIK